MIKEGDLIARRIKLWHGTGWVDNGIEEYDYLEEIAIVLKVEGKISGDQMIQILTLGETIPEWTVVREHNIKIIAKS